MADTSIAVTAGTGTSVDTRTEATNSNHRQVVCLGDPSVNTAVATVTTPSAADALAMLCVRPYGAPGSDWNYAPGSTGITNTTTAATIKAAAGAGLRNYVTAIQIQTATLGGATGFVIRDGASGTALFRTQLQTTALPLLNITFPSPLRSSTNTLLEIAAETAVTGAIMCNAQGYVAP